MQYATHSAAKTHHLVAVAEASETFYGIMSSIAAKAIHLPGAVNQLGGRLLLLACLFKLIFFSLIGKCMEEMSSGYRRISQQYHNVVSMHGMAVVQIHATDNTPHAVCVSQFYV